jgi:hypothetical protein
MAFKNLGLTREWRLISPEGALRVWFANGGLGGLEVARASGTVAPAAGAYASPYPAGTGDRGSLVDVLPPADGVADGGVCMWARSVGPVATMSASWE